MSRTKILLAILLTVVLGFLAGWWLSSRAVAPVSPVTEQAASSSARPRVTSGYCCLTAGEACVEVDNAASCFSRKGEGFHTGKRTCDTFCVRIGLLQSRKK